MTLLRVLAVVVVLAIIVVATVPMLVVADLVGGGSGWGLCPDGLSSCRTSYFDGPELAAFLLVVLSGLVLALRVVQLAQRRLESRRRRRVSGPLSPPRAPARSPGEARGPAPRQG